MSTYYLVDFENVHNEGLKGCSTLSKDDQIYLFYSKNANNLNMDVFKDYSGKKPEYIPAKTGNQALDKLLVSYLGFLLAKDGRNYQYIIISKDKGYDDVIAYWKTKGYRIDRCEVIQQKKLINPKISQNISKNKKEQKNKKVELNDAIQKKLSKEGKYKAKAINQIAGIVVKCYGKDNFKSEVHNQLRKKYDEFQEIYKDIKPVLEEFE